MFVLFLVRIFLLLLIRQTEGQGDIISHTGEICFDELGCFSAVSPFSNIVKIPSSMLPGNREDINTKFQLYTPLNPKLSIDFSNLDDSLKVFQQCPFNLHMKTIFVVPGFMHQMLPVWTKILVDALLAEDGSNVFLVDWSGSEGLHYPQAVSNTRVVGAEISYFIQRLESIVGIKPESVHIIGHSLGCHIAGYAGKRLHKLGRITGLDPAGPLFMNVEPVLRLDKEDAQLVDVIHTNAAEIPFQGFGLMESIGHFDFYPNGGRLQPGCQDTGHGALSFLRHIFGIDAFWGIICSHTRVVDLFISSITSRECEMMATPCDSWESFVTGKCGTCESGKGATCVPLGIHVDRFAAMVNENQSLNYYLNTTSKPPYCIQGTALI